MDTTRLSQNTSFHASSDFWQRCREIKHRRRVHVVYQRLIKSYTVTKFTLASSTPFLHALPNQALLPLSLTPLDIRDYLWPVVFLSVFSPACTSVLSWYGCAVVGLLYLSLPAIVRLRYTRFMRSSIVDDLRISAGATMAFIASTTALMVQTHDPRISTALHFHSNMHTRSLARLLRTYLYVEVAHNGSSEEKEQIASWLRWIHRSVHGTMTDEMRAQLGIPEELTTYGYIDELKAFVLATLAWSTIAFQSRYGRRLSQRAKDAIVSEYNCVGLRLGISGTLLSKDYDSFVERFDRQLEILEDPCLVSQMRLAVFEDSLLAAKKSWIMEIIVRCALILGYDLLPETVKEKYTSKLSQARYTPLVRGFLSAILWLMYPMLMCLPLRGMICMILVLESSLRPIFMSSLQAIHSMDILTDEPVFGGGHDTSANGLPAYIEWLDGGKDGRPFLQRMLVRVLAAQLHSKQAGSWSIAKFTPWIVLPGRITLMAVSALTQELRSTVSNWRVQIKESATFKTEISLPNHVGLIMDGNRRWARELGQPVIMGHRKGAQTAVNLVQWWIRFIPNAPAVGPRYLTLWAFSSENFKRSEDELSGLFRLMEGEFKSLAFAPAVHLFGIRVRVVGSKDALPRQLIDTIELLESTTAGYSSLFLQIAVGYGGRDDIVRSVKHVLAQGEEVTEDSISRSTFCSRAGVPPVDLIVRTSERRTSGFMLWDTQGAELQFIDKLWPELTEMDWLCVLKSYGNREMRMGK